MTMVGNLIGQTYPPPKGWTARVMFGFVLSMTALIPLENFLVTLIATAGAPDGVLFALQFVIEALIYFACTWVVIGRLLAAGRFRRTPLEAPLLAVLAVVTLSVAVNDAPIVGSLMNVRSALRYTAVFYLVVNLGLTRRQVAAVLWVILFSGLAQVGFGYAQWVVGEDLKFLMMPTTVGLEVAGKSRNFPLIVRGRELGSVFGSLGDTLYYGLFLTVVLAVALPRVRHWRWGHRVDVGVLTLGVAYSYSRAAVIAAVLTLLAFAAQSLGVKRVAAACVAVLAVGLCLIALDKAVNTNREGYQNPGRGQRSIVYNMTSMFSPTYFERAKRQRLGMLLGVAPTSLMNAPVLGFGPDQRHTISQLNQARQTRLYKTLGKEGFEDVYWVALLCYVGLAGVLAVLWLGIRLVWTCAKVARKADGDPVVRWAGVAALCVISQAFVLMWFNRVPEMRAFSFYFWLLPALAYAAASAKPDGDAVARDEDTIGHETR